MKAHVFIQNIKMFHVLQVCLNYIGSVFHMELWQYTVATYPVCSVHFVAETGWEDVSNKEDRENNQNVKAPLHARLHITFSDYMQ